jgi:diguanylate cyclase (GGDEF)-like protein/PAS domain S-box-containing protein
MPRRTRPALLPARSVRRVCRLLAVVSAVLIGAFAVPGMAGLAFAQAAPAAQTLRVGVYDNPPKVFQLPDGQATGSFIELLREMAKLESWQLEFVRCDWEACLQMLQNGELDLMPDVAPSATRSAALDFHQQPAMHSWSQLYSRPGLRMESVLDLDNKSVAVLTGSVQTEALKQMLTGFNVRFSIVPAESPAQAFELTRSGLADVAATSFHFGDYRSKEFGLVRTPVMFQATALYFATARQRHPEVLSAIDRHLAAWVPDADSPYHRVLRTWGLKSTEAPIAGLLRNAVTGVLLLGVLPLLSVLWLRRSVRLSTRALRRSNDQLQATLRAVPDVLLEIDEAGTHHEVHAARAELLIEPAQTMLGKRLQDTLPPLAAEICMKAILEARDHGVSSGQLISLPLPQGQRWFELSVARKDMPDGAAARYIMLSRDVTERQQAQAALAQLTGLYAAISQCNEAIVRSTDQQDLLQRVCQAAVDHGGMAMAWVGRMDPDRLRVLPVASYGHGTEFLKNLEVSLAPGSATGEGPTAIAVRTDQPYWCQDFQADPRLAYWHDKGRAFGWAALASVPLHLLGQVTGVLVLYAARTGAFDDAAQQLLLRMAGNLDVALERHHLQAERERLTQRIMESEEQYRELTESINDVIWTQDPKTFRYLYVSPAVQRLRGYTAQELMSDPMGALMQTEDAERMRGQMVQDVADFEAGRRSTHDVRVTELELPRKGGGTVWVEVIANLVLSPRTGRLEIHGVTRDISERKTAQARIAHLAEFDHLTGLPNRAQLRRLFEQALALARRAEQNLAVLFLDLDHFKHINDSLGHDVGDQLLVQMAQRLQAERRSSDVCCRMGGDEFILVLPDTDAPGAAQAARRLLERTAEPCWVGNHEIASSVSMGIAMFPHDGTDMDTLLRNADVAMYQAKSEGRQDFRFFTPEMQARSDRTLVLSTALTQALARQQLSLHYQPLVDLHSGAVVGAEALLRWQHPQLGAVSPAEFIAVAENNGQILAIGEWVLQQAAQQASLWVQSGTPLTVAVNISAVQFRRPDFAQSVAAALSNSQLPAQWLELELTESIAMGDPKAAAGTMDQLHALGVRLAIDDFGTGYSSLGYLRRLRFHKLKIDQSFVRDIGRDSDDEAIILAMIGLANSLGLITLAEGVETPEQARFLQLHGCQHMQGFQISPALRVEQFEGFLREHQPRPL